MLVKPKSKEAIVRTCKTYLDNGKCNKNCPYYYDYEQCTWEVIKGSRPFEWKLGEIALSLSDCLEVGDIIKTEENHYYEICDFDDDGNPISQPACFKHWKHEIVAVYRNSGKNFKLIWERKNEVDE